MSISFSRSMRSLQSDSFRPSLATLIIASILIIAWFVWLVFAPITIYQTSQDWELQRDGTLLVRYPVDVVQQFKPGQAVVIDAQTSANQSVQLTGVVADVPMPTQNRLPPNTVKVTIRSGKLPEGTTSATVRVATGTTTPLTLITSAASQVASP